MKFAILKNEFDDGHENWAHACKKRGIDFEIIDLTSNTWFEQLQAGTFRHCLACPPGRQRVFKELYDERAYVIERVSGCFLYPNYREISLHENKKYLSYWLKAKKLPHPHTHVFYNRQEALSFARQATLPLVGKLNIGASGKGVRVLRRREELLSYINSAFSTGIRGQWGPNIKMGSYTNRFMKLIREPTRVLKRLGAYRRDHGELQKGYVILQDYVEHSHEWRIVRIGKSYFGHQKTKCGDKASGTKGINYVLPPAHLLDFVAEICLANNFNSMAIDLFEDGKGGYLINELQCIFGHVQEYICEKNGTPGRLVRESCGWRFEEGLFNSNLSYDLRLENALALAEKRVT
ncbi:MAG: hypothetical protein GF344_11470 [Chitinivibrionales bacterium]|nr:hypothetical protein [Chitinivibrionales bacterium]